MKKNLKNVVSAFMVLTVLGLQGGVFAEADASENYELRVLTFEDEGNDNYWSGLIAEDQYSDPLLYGGSNKESEAYRWYDKGNTELMHILPYNYGVYNYWGGGHAISNYASTDFETYGDYMSQLTVFMDKEFEEGVMVRECGGNNGSDNFVVHYGYKDDSGFNGTENLPALSFADGKARVIDHMYVNITTYQLYCFLEGNGFSEPLGENDWVKIIATGYNGTKETGSVEFYLVDFTEGILVLEWTPWDLSELGAVTRVEFNLMGSSDNGYGFSQPSYFAYDDVAVRFEMPSVSGVNVVRAQSDNAYDYSFNVKAPEITDGTVVMAMYVGDRFLGMDLQSVSNGENEVGGSIKVSEVPDNYRIMIWDGMGQMKPLCDVVQGNIN